VRTEAKAATARWAETVAAIAQASDRIALKAQKIESHIGYPRQVHVIATLPQRRQAMVEKISLDRHVTRALILLFAPLPGARDALRIPKRAMGTAFKSGSFYLPCG
jgi:hypothetical protein